MNQSLFSALWLEKMAISITIGLIVMVAALNIVASLILLVMEKSRDIAILKTMGSSAASIRRIFMLQGLIIGVVGTAGRRDRRLRADLRARSLQADSRADRRLPDRLRAVQARCRSTSPVVIAAAVLICFVATIYPSRQASRLDPAQALRYQ